MTETPAVQIDPLQNLPTTSPGAASEAREQAAEYDSIFAATPLVLDDGTTIMVPPPPGTGLIDEDAQDAINELNLRLESFDRWPDVEVPEQTVYDENNNIVSVLPASTRPGVLKTRPYRRTDPQTSEVIEVLKPDVEAQQVIFVLGKQAYDKLRAATVNGVRGSQADVWRIWHKQSAQILERQKIDSKSNGRAVDSAPVLQADTA